MLVVWEGGVVWLLRGNGKGVVMQEVVYVCVGG